jgi:dihydroorotase
MKTIIKNGRLIDPSAGIDEKRDVVIEDGLVAGIAKPGGQAPSGVEVIDIDGCIVMPGLIDLHVHLREPGFESKETVASGSMAAVSGGFTSICCMANTDPVNDNIALTGFILQKAREAGTTRVFPLGSVTRGLEGESLTEMGELMEAGCVAFSDDGKCVMNADMMRNALIYAKSFDVPIAVHAVDVNLAGKGVMHEGYQSMRLGLPGVPSAAEDVMVARDTLLATQTGARLHIQHVTTKCSLSLIRNARAQGARVTAEAAPHHFMLTDKDIGNYNTNMKMMPPLRTEADREAIIEALADGTIDAVATDHAPHGRLLKDCEFENAANGCIGLETALALLWELVRTGRLSAMRAVELLTSGPARVFSLPHGTLKPGVAADLTVFDPRPEYIFDSDRIRSLSKNSPFLGRAMQGQVIRTIVQGRTVFQR